MYQTTQIQVDSFSQSQTRNYRNCTFIRITFQPSRAAGSVPFTLPPDGTFYSYCIVNGITLYNIRTYDSINNANSGQTNKTELVYQWDGINLIDFDLNLIIPESISPPDPTGFVTVEYIQARNL